MTVAVKSHGLFDQERSADLLPPHVEALVGREKEIACIVYARGASTAREVQSRLSATVSNAAVRSMLMRLVDKGVLRLDRGQRGPGHPSTYFPTVTPNAVKQRALAQLADRYFDGSLLNLVQAALEELKRQETSDRRPTQRYARPVRPSFDRNLRAHS